MVIKRGLPEGGPRNRGDLTVFLEEIAQGVVQPFGKDLPTDGPSAKCYLVGASVRKGTLEPFFVTYIRFVIFVIGTVLKYSGFVMTEFRFVLFCCEMPRYSLV